MEKAFDYAVRLGHKNIGYITGDLNFFEGKGRLEIFKKLAVRYKVKTNIAEGNFSRTSGYNGAALLLAGRVKPTLIMASSDRAAMGVIDYSAEKGFIVPDDISIIGYDNLPPALDTKPPLTTINNPITDIAYEAVMLLADIIENKIEKPKGRLLDTDLVIRNSTGDLR
jgi:LacI family repressor for deo operon, udp, cdd, tsx, nupC, and nupG